MEYVCQVAGLDIQPAGDGANDGYVIYQPELDRVHYLNSTAVAILELCDGSNSPEAIAALIAEANALGDTPAPLDEAIPQAMAQLAEAGLVK